MKNLVRGGVVLSLIGMFVMLVFAQTRTEKALSIANDSQKKLKAEIKLENNLTAPSAAIPAPTFEGTSPVPTAGETDDSKLIKKTVSSKAVASRGRGSFVATAYCLKGKTAMGHSVRRGIIAADPRVLKLGSKVSLSGGGYSGDYLVSDTGGRIKGNKIDIWVASCSEARRFGRRTVQISQ